MSRHFITALCLLMLPACEFADDKITFVTTSSIGIGTDAETATATVGYDRQELVIAPLRPGTGGIDPLYADIQQDRNLTRPRVKQSFATGRAAEIISLPVQNTSRAEIEGIKSRTRSAVAPDPNGRRNKVLVFGTTSSVGLKVSATANSLPEVQLGYKRKERASIPLQTGANGARTEAPSLLGNLSIGVEADVTQEGQPAVNFDLRQIIATGKAAENAASSEKLRGVIENKVSIAASKDLCPDGQRFDEQDSVCKAITVLPTATGAVTQ